MTVNSLELTVRVVKGVLIFVLFVVNFTLLGKYFTSGRPISRESPSPFLWVVVVTPGNAELFLTQEELDKYLKEHSEYSFLIPVGAEKAVQEQIQASYHRKIPTGAGEPYLKVDSIDHRHQLIEITMAGDPHNDIFWYEASDKTITPRSWQIFGVGHAFVMLVLAPLLIVPEYFIATLLANMIGGWLLKPLSLTSSL
jgi:hypothetical protein